MITKVVYEFSGDEIKDHLAYDFICTCMASHDFECRKIRTKFEELFTEEEQSIIRKTIYGKARKWYFKTGAPEKVEMDKKEYDLWQKMKQFCFAFCKK